MYTHTHKHTHTHTQNEDAESAALQVQQEALNTRIMYAKRSDSWNFGDSLLSRGCGASSVT